MAMINSLSCSVPHATKPDATKLALIPRKTFLTTSLGVEPAMPWVNSSLMSTAEASYPAEQSQQLKPLSVFSVYTPYGLSILFQTGVLVTDQF